MSPERFDHLVSIVTLFIQKRYCRSRDVIPVGERVAVCLRYLATGDSQQSQSFLFRLGRTTVCKIIHETCEAIWCALRKDYLKAPSCKEDWKIIAHGFKEQWNFPNCIGAIDGKHVCIECPKNAGSSYYNYKSFHSMVLLAVCDSRYTFTMVDIGSYGRDNDAAIFGASAIAEKFGSNLLDVPEAEIVNGNRLSYTLVGDDAFPLKSWLMKPYPGKNLTIQQRIYNYRTSRARRTIENAFGILAAKWRIFCRPTRASPETVECIIKATICLHNYLRLTENANYLPSGFVDCENNAGDIIPGDWRKVISDEDAQGLQHLPSISGNRHCFSADEMRTNYMNYFNSHQGQVPWQMDHVQQNSKIRD